MTEIKELLEDADPLRSEETLSPAEAQVLRTAMLEAAVTAPRTVRSVWHRPLAVAAIVIVLIGLSGATGDRSVKPSGDELRKADSVQRGGTSEKRQIQFATPGGTRIIWILDADAPAQEPMP